jgi:hypothetical protein
MSDGLGCINQARVPMPQCAFPGDRRSLKLQGNRAMTTKIKKGQRVGRNPKTGTEVPNPPRLVIVFTPSAILKQRINGRSRGRVA